MRNGIICSLLSSVSFALLYYIVTLMRPLGGLELLGIRSIVLLPALMVILAVLRLGKQVDDIVNKIKKNKKILFVPIFLAALIGALQWVFFWAPLNGKALDVSLGFFLLPLLMVLFGTVAYREKLTVCKGIAVLLACLGVANLVWQSGGISWPALSVSFGYVIYIATRKKFGINNLGGLLVETIILFPVALFLVINGSIVLTEAIATQAGLYWLLPTFCIISVCSLTFYIVASDLLPMSLFGLLTYIEPVLLLFVSLSVGETMKEGEIPTFVLLLLALLVLGIEGVRSIGHEMKMRRKFSHQTTPVASQAINDASNPTDEQI